MAEPSSVDDLVRTLRFERARLVGKLAGLSSERMQRPGVEDTWSVSDIIAHLTVWERRGTDWILSLARGEEPAIPLPGHTADELDQLNLQTYEENRGKPAEEVLAAFESSFAGLLEGVRSLEDEDLERSFEAYWADGERYTLQEVIRWRYFHYRAHAEHIDTWLTGLDRTPE